MKRMVVRVVGRAWRRHVGALGCLLAFVSCGDDSVSGDAPLECERPEPGDERCTDSVGGGDDCGDGVVQRGEECDDGNTRNTDGCVEDCKEASCGDAFVHDGVEECDEGDEGNQLCTGNCTLTTVAAECGDGIVEGDEQCDDANARNTDDCVEGCRLAECGDGFVQAEMEACDDGNDDMEDCSEECELARCGDGVVQGDEECDDGNDDMEDACLTTCVRAVCGDGIIARKSSSGEEGPEHCDFGAMPADATGTECEAEPESYNGPVPCYCGEDCRISGEGCGNGVIDPSEECDDGQLDQCDQSSFNHDNASCTSRCVWNRCGDGFAYVLETNSDHPGDLEECDDANNNNNDACVIDDLDGDEELDCHWNTCGDGSLYSQGYDEVYDQEEDGLDSRDYSPCAESSEPSCDPIGALLDDDFVCDNPFPTEECDDGNGTPNDECSNECASP